jgi:hypothetical protein
MIRIVHVFGKDFSLLKVDCVAATTTQYPIVCLSPYGIVIITPRSFMASHNIGVDISPTVGAVTLHFFSFVR